MKINVVILLLLFLVMEEGYSQQSYTAYIFVAEECPVCNYLGKTLKRLSTEYVDDVKFVAVFPQRMSNYKTASLFKKKYELPLFTVEIDHDQVITDKYQATVTPEVVLVNEENHIIYQGRINNSYAAPGRMRHGKITEDLEIAINLVLNDRKIPEPWPAPIGCYITKR